MATAKKNTSATSHQRDLARMSGNTAAAKKAKSDRAKYGRTTMDSTGSAAGRAESKALKSFGLKKAVSFNSKVSRQVSTTKTAKPSTVQQIAKRFGVTAREARDIATAVTTLGKAVVTPAGNYGSRTKNKGATIVKAAGDVAKQAGETYTAATKGKSGTSALKLKTMFRGASGLPSDVEYKTGSKRKQGSKK